MNEALLANCGEEQFIDNRISQSKEYTNCTDVPGVFSFAKQHKVDQINLMRVALKLSLPQEKGGQGWTQERVQKGILQYRMFLKLCLIYPEKNFCPVEDIDEVWHTHVLDTRNYHADCKNIFGHYLHHTPFVGNESVQEAQMMRDGLLQTIELFKTHFGEEIVLFNVRESALQGRCFCNNNCCGNGACSSNSQE